MTATLNLSQPVASANLLNRVHNGAIKKSSPPKKRPAIRVQDLLTAEVPDPERKRDVLPAMRFPLAGIEGNAMPYFAGKGKGKEVKANTERGRTGMNTRKIGRAMGW